MVEFNIEKKTQSQLFDLIANYKGEVVYGVPRETANARRHDNKDLDKPEYNNAEILAVMEAGSVINNIPPRQLLKPVRIKYQKQINEMLINVCNLLLEGNQEAADNEMEKLALRIEGWTKQYFTDSDNNWAPNAYITIHGGWMKNKKSGKVFYVKGKKSDKPLIDTGELRKSIRAIFYKEGKQ